MIKSLRPQTSAIDKKTSAVSKHLLQRMPLYSDNVRYIMCWAQKAGCTSVLKWFFYHAGLLDTAREYCGGGADVELHDYYHYVFKKQEGYPAGLARNIALGDTEIVNFFRCPYERAFSMYMHLHNRHFVGMNRKGKLTPGIAVRKAILLHIYGQEVSLEYTFSFAEFLGWLDQTDISTLDPHFQPQYRTLFDAVDVSHYQLSDFHQVARNLEQKANLPSSSDHGVFTSSGHHVPKEPVDEKVIKQILYRGFPMIRAEYFAVPRVDKALLQQTNLGELVARIFKQDVALFDATPLFAQTL